MPPILHPARHAEVEKNCLIELDALKELITVSPRLIYCKVNCPAHLDKKNSLPATTSVTPLS
jgi:hypothetical protein